MRLFIPTLILVLTFGSLNAQTFELELKSIEKDYYAWITSLNEGPTKRLDEPDGDVRARANRICITTSEIYNSLYIEEVTFGRERCCKKIASKKQLDLYELFDKFELQGEVANIKFGKWLNFSTFELEIQGRTFSIELQDNLATVKLN